MMKHKVGEINFNNVFFHAALSKYTLCVISMKYC